MKLLVSDSAGLARHLNREVGADTSIVLRYCDALEFFDDPTRDLAFKRSLREASQGEGVRVFHLLTYRGVDVHLVDETSRMATGSLKAVDGCLTTSFCRMEGEGRIAFESGGNTGSALTSYGQRAGLETFFFFPSGNVDLLDSRLFVHRTAHLIGVEERGQVKELTGLFAQRAGIRRVPERPWRHAASMLRGLCLVEHMLPLRGYDWIVQTVSAAFGPIGIYSVFDAFRGELRTIPRFLGVQQEANCPMVRAWKAARGEGPVRPGEQPGNLLTRVMYDEAPQTYQTVGDLEALLRATDGDMVTVNEAEFGRDSYPGGEDGRVLELLRERGVPITLRIGRILEKTGLIALAGTLKAIDEGVIEGGSTVLCCLTSGVSRSDGRAQPEVTVRGPEDVEAYCEEILGKRSP